MRNIQRFHMGPGGLGSPTGGCDVGYNFLFCKHGFVFEGRGWRHKSGATGSANSHSVAICFLGDDTKGRDDVTFAGRVALSDWLRAAERHYSGAQTVRGHRDFMATACPGNELHNWVRTGAWKRLGLAKIRYELWARRKDPKDGKLKPALFAKSSVVPPNQARDRATKFMARVGPQYITLLAAGRKPNIRKVFV